MSNETTIFVECTCLARYEVAAEHQGEIFDCSNCGREIVVPTPEFSANYRKLVEEIDRGNDFQRAKAYAEIATLKDKGNAVAGLMKGVYDSSRTVVNTCLVSLLVIGPEGRDELVKFMREGALRVSRLVSAIKESDNPQAVDELCELIDAGLFGEGQISQMIKLLGESERQRAIPTLKTLRRAYPNLAMLVDNALANYKHLDSQVNRIPDDAKTIRDSDGHEKTMAQAASLRQTNGKRGCMPTLIALIVPALTLVGAGLWKLYQALF